MSEQPAKKLKVPSIPFVVFLLPLVVACVIGIALTVQLFKSDAGEQSAIMASATAYFWYVFVMLDSRVVYHFVTYMKTADRLRDYHYKSMIFGIFTSLIMSLVGYYMGGFWVLSHPFTIIWVQVLVPLGSSIFYLSYERSFQKQYEGTLVSLEEPTS